MMKLRYYCKLVNLTTFLSLLLLFAFVDVDIITSSQVCAYALVMLSFKRDNLETFIAPNHRSYLFDDIENICKLQIL